MICNNCIHLKVCKDYSIYKDTIYACEDFKDGTIKNQYDRIRHMSVEEMASVIAVLGDFCKDEVMGSTTNPIKIKKYLESEVDTE